MGDDAVKIVIEAERAGDEDAIRHVTTEAFRGHPYSQGQEPGIVDGLRKSGALSVSLVARVEGAIAGHVAASPMKLEHGAEGWFGIGPLSVLPGLQRQGIGSALMKALIGELKARSARGLVLVGEPEYYRRFGINVDPAISVRGVPAQYCMSLRFTPCDDHGQAGFHPAFGV